MAARRRFLLLIPSIALAVVVFQTRVRHEMIDFVTWRQAAVRALHGEPLYRAEDGHYQFKYFQTFALMMAPFGAIDRESGKALWFAIEVALAAALVYGSVAALPDRRQSIPVLRWLTFLLMAKFYAREVLLGQTNLPLAGLLIGALAAIQRNRPVAAGALAGAAVFVKPYALILVPWLLAIRRWRGAAIAACVVTVGLFLPAIIYGWRGNLDLLSGWLRTVSDSTSPNLLGNDNVSIAAMWAKWIGPGVAASSLAGLTVLATVALAVTVIRRRRRVSAPEYLECALLMILIPLISPQGWDYVLLLATPAVVCILDLWRDLAGQWRVTLGLALVVMCLTMFDIMGRRLYGQFMALSIVSVCALVVVVGLVHLRWRDIA